MSGELIGECWSCVAWHHASRTCRLNPPVIVTRVEGPISTWPPTNGGDGCVQHTTAADLAAEAMADETSE